MRDDFTFHELGPRHFVVPEAAVGAQMLEARLTRG